MKEQSATSDATDTFLDELFGLIEIKIPEHHLMEKFIADCKGSIKEFIESRVEVAEQRVTLEKDIKYHTLKAKLQDMFIGGEKDALLSKHRVKQLKKRLAALKNEGK